MFIEEIKDKDNLDDPLRKQPHARFLQSWQWGNFQKSVGREIVSLGDSNLTAIKMPLFGGKFYWYIPHGNITAPSVETLNYKSLFLRVDPLSNFKPDSNYRWRFVPSTQPQCVRVLDLTKTEEEMLGAMHPKTRYNINLSERKGVAVGPGSITEFLKLNHATSQRDEFISHPDAYYQKMIKALTGDCAAKIWQASFNGQALASAIVIYFGDTATYAHGASSNEGRNLMAPYLLHWKIMQDARRQGFKFYDLGGVNPADENDEAYKPSWQGITRFKQGFGGEIRCNPRSFDLIYRPFWYRLYKLFKTVKKLL